MSDKDFDYQESFDNLGKNIFKLQQEIDELKTWQSEFRKVEDISEQYKQRQDKIQQQLDEVKQEVAKALIIASAKAVIVPEEKSIFWTGKIELAEQNIIKLEERTSLGGKIINKCVEDWFRDTSLTPLGRKIDELKEAYTKKMIKLDHWSLFKDKRITELESVLKDLESLFKLIIEEFEYQHPNDCEIEKMWQLWGRIFLQKLSCEKSPDLCGECTGLEFPANDFCIECDNYGYRLEVDKKSEEHLKPESQEEHFFHIITCSKCGLMNKVECFEAHKLIAEFLEVHKKILEYDESIRKIDEEKELEKKIYLYYSGIIGLINEDKKKWEARKKPERFKTDCNKCDLNDKCDPSFKKKWNKRDDCYGYASTLPLLIEDSKPESQEPLIFDTEQAQKNIEVTFGKKPVVDPYLDLWERGTITVECPFCHEGYYLAPKKIENRILGKVYDKIESMRLKYANDKNYSTMSLMNDLWDYQRGLKEGIEK